jgi:hypothetical protein
MIAILSDTSQWPYDRCTNQGNELSPLHLSPLAAEELARDYQFSEHTASVCEMG